MKRSIHAARRALQELLRRPSPYVRLGIALVFGGALFVLIAWLIVSSIPLVAFGLSVILIGVVALALARSLPDVPPEASSVMLRTGLENLSALVEEIGLTAPALYLPSRLTGSVPMALIPLRHNSAQPSIRRALATRLIVSYGPDTQDVGLLVRTAGTTVMQLLESRPGGSPAELESAMVAVLVGRLDLANGLRFYREGTRMVVEVAAPRLDQRDLWISRSLGSPLASIVATMAAEGLDTPVRIQGEDWSAGQVVIALEPLNEAIQ